VILHLRHHSLRKLQIQTKMKLLKYIIVSIMLATADKKPENLSTATTKDVLTELYLRQSVNTLTQVYSAYQIRERNDRKLGSTQESSKSSSHRSTSHRSELSTLSGKFF
jgi:hypothetical protein